MLTNEQLLIAKVKAKIKAQRVWRQYTGLIYFASAFLATWLLIRFGEAIVGYWQVALIEGAVVIFVFSLWVSLIVCRRWVAGLEFEKYYRQYIEEEKVMQ
jgi:hypothetical protein